jgi:hypothetical protein
MDTLDSPRPGLGGSYHLPPYSIHCTSPWGPHPNGFLSRDSQVGVSKSPRLGLPLLWGAITLRTDIWLRWGPKHRCIPYQELSNGMLHAIFTYVNRVDSQLLLVGSQTANLTHGPSFDHNLCFKCPNWQCEPILDIYVSRAFHWYKELLKPLSLAPEIALWRFESPPRLQFPKWNSLGVWGFVPSHLLTLPGVRCVTPGFFLGL